MDELETEVQPKFIVVSIYEVNKAYGGPEEGGWWYTYGTPYIDLAWMAKVFRVEEEQEAREYQAKLDEVCKVVNREEKRHPPSSVRCDGWLTTQLDFGHWPKDFPEERPHYE